MSKYDQLYMDIADRLGQQSHSTRAKVGAVLVKDGSIIAEGWNGTPHGWSNECEEWMPGVDHGDGTWVTKKEVLHAESNALMKVAKSTQSSDGACLYTVYSPCLDCAKLIVQSGVKRVVYSINYRDEYPINFLEKNGIEVDKIER